MILDGAKIGENSIVGAAAFVKARAEFGARQMILGSPAKFVRELRPDEIEWKKKGTREYQDLVIRCQQTMHQVEPLREVEAGRSEKNMSSVYQPKLQK
ncbi:Carnitine operon protein CaiE [compost metagenome]